MSKKVMLGIISVLAIALFVETGYLLGIRDKSKQSEDTRKTCDISKTNVPNDVPSMKQIQTARSYPRVFDDSLWTGSRRGVWDPFEEMEAMHRTMDRMFKNSFGRARQSSFPVLSGYEVSFEPDLDFEEREDMYIVTLDLPGIDKDRIDIKITEHAITLSGERVVENEESDDEGRFYRMERSSGSFMRTIPLPRDADRMNIEAKMDQGVLRITIPKQKTEEEEVPSTVPVE